MIRRSIILIPIANSFLPQKSQSSFVSRPIANGSTGEMGVTIYPLSLHLARIYFSSTPPTDSYQIFDVLRYS